MVKEPQFVWGGGIEFGNQFSSNRNCFFGCNHHVIFGDNVLLGWNVNIRDSDNHTIFWNGNEETSQKRVFVGNHVWICSYADVLKGVIIPDDSVVAYRALVTKQFTESHSLIAGCPAKIIKNNISWEK